MKNRAYEITKEGDCVVNIKTKDGQEYPNNLIRVHLLVDFHVMRETLSRIGLVDRNSDQSGRTLVQLVHILHKHRFGRSIYYLTHFKQLYALDGKTLNSFDEKDVARLEYITGLLLRWGMIDIDDEEKRDFYLDNIDMESYGVKVLSYEQKQEWNLTPRYQVGERKR